MFSSLTHRLPKQNKEAERRQEQDKRNKIETGGNFIYFSRERVRQKSRAGETVPHLTTLPSLSYLLPERDPTFYKGMRGTKDESKLGKRKTEQFKERHLDCHKT